MSSTFASIIKLEHIFLCEIYFDAPDTNMALLKECEVLGGRRL